ncbi:hypothetical protein KKA47_02460, partial [bacterium]|nr:hypothetical protein [bacterium]
PALLNNARQVWQTQDDTLSMSKDKAVWGVGCAAFPACHPNKKYDGGQGVGAKFQNTKLVYCWSKLETLIEVWLRS